MTKMKSKKMSKSTFAVIIMAILMVVMLAFGGTYAYFTATTNKADSDTITLGKVSLKMGESAVSKIEDVEAVPGEEIATANVSLTNDSTVSTYVAVVMTIEYDGEYYESNGTTWGTAKDGKVTLTATDMANVLTLPTISGFEALTGEDEGVYIAAKTTGEAGAQTTSYVVDADADLTFLNGKIALSSALDRNFTEGVVDLPEVGANGAKFFVWEDADIIITIRAYQIQAQGHGENAPTTAAAVWTLIEAECTFPTETPEVQDPAGE